MIQVETTLSVEEAFSRVKHLMTMDGVEVVEMEEPSTIIAKQGRITSMRLRDTPKELVLKINSSVMGSNLTIQSTILSKVDFLIIGLAATVLSMNTILNLLSIFLFSMLTPAIQRSVIATSLLGIGFFLLALIDLTFTHLRVDVYAESVAKKHSPWVI